MPAYQVTRSTLIESPIEKVRKSLCDFRQWPKWSPWLIIEREAKVNFNDSQGEVKAAYDWKGELTGEGSMVLASISDNKLEMDLTFLTPFKSTAKVSFDLEEHANGTNVTWNMDSKLPFFLFWMVKNIKAYIGMDYERGLRMLKDYIETGSVASTININGITTIKSQHYVGIANQCNIEEMSEVMPKDFKTLQQFLQDSNLSQDITPFAIYNSFDILDKNMQFISAVPVDKKIKVTAPFISGELESGDVVKVTHTGAYKHLGNGWSAAFNFARHKKIKNKKKPVGMEFYLSDPLNTPTEELITEVLVPIK